MIHAWQTKLLKRENAQIGWHFDDLKISHQDRTVEDHVINLLELEFAKEAPLTKTRGKIHDYLIMVLDYSIPGMVKIVMKEYVREIISEAQGAHQLEIICS